MYEKLTTFGKNKDGLITFEAIYTQSKLFL